MFGKFFDTTAVDDFVARVLKDVSGTLSPEQAEGDAGRSVKQREQASERARRQAEALATATALNVYQKAQLGMRLGEALEAAGYPKAFTKAFSYEVVSVVALAASKRR